MQIELIGCTGAGKSTLLVGLLSACREQGLQATSGDDYVLARARLGRLKSYLARTLVIDLFTISASLGAWRKYSSFYKLAFRLIFSLKKVGWFEKLNILRNTFKKVGIYEIIQKTASEQQIIILDEGTLHTAHYLFVHLSAAFTDADLAGFATIVPLPDYVIYVRQPKELLVERTLARGHKRIRSGSRDLTERFIRRAMATFEKLAEAPSVAARTFIVDSPKDIHLPQAVQNKTTQASTLAVLEAALALVGSS